MSNKQKAVAILNALASGDASPIEQYVSDKTYIQHNLAAQSGKAAFLGLVPIMGDDASVNVVRVIEDGDLVACHTEYYLAPFGGALAGFDIFPLSRWNRLWNIGTICNPSLQKRYRDALNLMDPLK